MASGRLGYSNDDLNSKGRCRWTENFKVYTRKTCRKAQKTCNNDDIAATTTSTADRPISAVPTPSTDQTPRRDEATSATAAAEVSAVSTSEKSTSPDASAGGHDAQEPVVTVGTKEVHSSEKSSQDSPHQEQSISHGSSDKNADLCCHQPLLEQLRHRKHVTSVAEDGCQTDERVQVGSDGHNAELLNLEGSQLPTSNEAQNLEKAPPLHGANELLQTTVVSPQVIRESSPLSSGNDLPNGREASTAQLPIRDEVQSGGMMQGSPRASQDNGSVNVNGDVKPGEPQVSTLQLPTGNDAKNGGEMLPGSPQISQGNSPIHVNGVVKPLVISSTDDTISINLCKATPKKVIQELRKNLECELDQVRELVKQLESKELQLASCNTQISNGNLSNSSDYISAEGANISGYSHSQPQHVRSDVADRKLLLRVNSEVGAKGHHQTKHMGLVRVNSDVGAARSLEPRLYNRQLSVAILENNRASEFVEKEKRTPKANQYYRNSEFLLENDRLPPESNKRLKTINGRKHSGETEHTVGFCSEFDKSRNQVFRNCSSLLHRLMKHKFGWVFNEPVNAKALGLFDYHDIIKHPMDLGTIKTRLSQNLYKSPREFAEDVRLVFHNAMTYNPRGQDVHFMAEQLLQIFEERWTIVESGLDPYGKYPMYQDGVLPTPSSRRAPPQSHFAPASIPVTASASTAAALVPLYASAAPQVRTSDRLEPMTASVAIDLKIHRPHVGRIPAPRKPKAKDPNKRDMTYDEKQRLSTNLQGLPPEKLDAIIQIIKKRNTALSQHDDEIEVDIDSVDTETLWELDRFVTNYKKSLSKNKRKAELALQARTLGSQNVALANLTLPVEVHNENGIAFEKSTALAEGEKRGYNSRLSSSSSSSSDSGPSSSDTDSDSSSGDGSDAGHSPKT